MTQHQINLVSIDQCTPQKLEEGRRSLPRLFTFIKRFVRKTISFDNSDIPYILALFSKERIMLDAYAGNSKIIEWFSAGGICPGGDWSKAGYNAVMEGFRTNTPVSSVGGEHENKILKELAVYFAPIKMLSPYEPYDVMEHCGVAFITPVQFADFRFLILARATAHDMMITLQFNNIATMYYERSGKGILSIDDRMSSTGEKLATYYNDDLFRILDTVPFSMYYQPVEALIDPPPSNHDLWDIVRNHKTVNNYPMTVTVHGKDVEVIASTDAYNQPSIDAHGVTFFFTTQQRIVAALSEKVANGAIKTFDDIIGGNQRFKSIILRAQKMAQTDSNIMILGESGTGKDIFAQAIHNASPRRKKPFVALNCGALPRDLIESELFGYESGAFSGARKNGNIGKFELANGGTIFLDEIGEMPLDLQVRLLRVVEQKQFMRLGGNKTVRSDVRIIAATNANIEEMIEQKLFRADLFYRLSTMKLEIPPLRERKEDILLLSNHFIRNISRKIDKPNIMRFSKEAEKLLVQLDWTGNIRELQNLIECIVQIYPGDIILPEYIMDNVSWSTKQKLLKPDSKNIEASPGSASFELKEADVLPPEPEYSSPEATPEAASHFSSWNFASGNNEKNPIPERKPELPSVKPTEDSKPDLQPPAEVRKVKHHRKLNREQVLQALEACGNNRSAAADYLGISRRTMYRKMEELGIE